MRFSTSFLVAAASVGFAAGTLADAAMRGSGVFPDVPQGAYYDSAVGFVYENGIITGYDDGRFGPDDFVTRGQIAVMMERLVKKIDGGDLSTGSSSSRSSRTSSSSSTSSSVSSVPGAGKFGFNTTQFDVPEANNAAAISIVRTDGSVGTVRVKYETIDATATAGNDYTSTSGEVTFTSGETQKTINVPLKEDQSGEAAETFQFRLKDPSGGAGLGSITTINVRILDNDGGAYGSSTSSSAGSTASVSSAGGFQFAASEYAISEDLDSLSVYVERVGGTKGSVTVEYATQQISGEAEAGEDFTATSGTFTFADGESERSFTVPITGDVDGDEEFELVLKNPTGGAVLVAAKSVVTIKDTDINQTIGSGTLLFEETEYVGGKALQEGETMPIYVIRRYGAVGTVTVNVKSSGLTASETSDYTPVNATLTFRPGETKKAVNVVIKTDTSTEDDETFRLTLSNPTGGAVLNSDNQTLITIED